MNKTIMLLLFIVGVINFLPVMGVISAARLSQGYSVELVGNDLVILMRHRALLFGVVGGFILYSVFAPQYQGPAMVMAAVSMIGYLYLMWSVGRYCVPGVGVCSQAICSAQLNEIVSSMATSLLTGPDLGAPSHDLRYSKRRYTSGGQLQR
jgi:hypothetical protein